MKLFILFVILSLIYCKIEDFIEIGSLEKTEFKVNKNKIASFKYKLGKEKGPIGLHFHLASLNTIKVSIYNKPNEDEQPIFSYFLFEQQFKEINIDEFEDYVYIVIQETYKYFYKDYITIYNPNEIIQLKPEEVLTLDNFLSNNKYQISFTSKDNILLLYNTLNLENNKRKITIKYNDEIQINQGEESQYNKEFPPGVLTITVENFADGKTGNQGFSLMVYERTNKYGFKEIIKNETTKTKYIYNNKKQEFYFYLDISNYIKSNILNFKLNFKYYLFKNNTNFLSKILYLDNLINDKDLEDEGNIPKENNFPVSSEINSDEFFRIYFKDINNENKYKYLLVKLEIIDEEYFIGHRNIEAFLEEEIKEHDLNQIDFNKDYIIKKKIINYIPSYFKLILNPEDKYILTSKYSQLSLFIKGDLLNDKNEINEDYLIENNEIIIASGIKELTIKSFGAASSEILFYAERINSSNFNYIENKRNNEIFQFSISEEECNNNNIKYILGNYDYESYGNGNINPEYYATVDSGDFTVYYKNKIEFKTDESIFPLDESHSIELNKEIILETNIDLFSIKCKKGGVMSIRPKTKIFEEKTHLIEQNSMNMIKLNNYTEIIQLTTLLGQNEGTLYFSILSLDGEKIIIIPDNPDIFNQKIIHGGELFSSSVNLSKFKMDQLAIVVNSSPLETNLEIVEIIHNKYNIYQKLNKGENKNIKLNNVFFRIEDNIDKFNITIENLQNKKLAYGIIKSGSIDENYLLTANNYPNITIINEMSDKIYQIEVENIYYKNKDNIKPYLFFLISILEEDDNLNYNIKVDIEDSEEDDDDENKIALIVTIALILSIIIGLIILAIYIILVKNRNPNDYDKLLYTQSLAVINNNDNGK